MLEEDIEIGSYRNALEAFDDLMATAIGMCPVRIHYWLDCYYKLRRLYEEEREEVRK